ncbi:hypothetical protein COO72_10835 [Bifidobacterium callitrichos]|nr:hypothetical protein COO72_10835 [Bifidobacterium callitrichos]
MSVIDDEANGLYPSPASLNMDDHTAEHRMSELQFMLRDAYHAGATRTPTDREVETVARLLWDRQIIVRPATAVQPWDVTRSRVLRARFLQDVRDALALMRRAASDDGHRS